MIELVIYILNERIDWMNECLKWYNDTMEEQGLRVVGFLV